MPEPNLDTNRGDARRVLLRKGVPKAAASTLLDRLTDEEIERLAQIGASLEETDRQERAIAQKRTQLATLYRALVNAWTNRLDALAKGEPAPLVFVMPPDEQLGDEADTVLDTTPHDDP